MSAGFLETAGRIGARLCRDAIWSGDRCNWIGGYKESTPAIVHRALGPEVYSGTSGIAFFLIHLFAATSERIFKITAEGAIRQALSKRESLKAGQRIGFFDGLSGIMHVATRFARVTRNDFYLTEASEIGRGLMPDGTRVDVINGSAGAIVPLLNLYRQQRNEVFMHLALAHAQVLIDRAARSDRGWSWEGVPKHEHNLTGFAHGAAGISTALLEIYAASRDTAFRDAAVEGFRYESGVFDAEEQNWPDFRYPPHRQPDGEMKQACATMWCHGAPGIGHSRLRALQVLGDGRWADEAKVAIATTSHALRDGPNGNYCLCHGHAGNAELLLYASTVLTCEEHTALAHQVGESGIERYENDRIPWPCGVLGGDEIPDLMLGLAGIGYFYLRLSDPASFPQILLVVPDAFQGDIG